jgi:hypothetical protein
MDTVSILQALLDLMDNSGSMQIGDDYRVNNADGKISMAPVGQFITNPSIQTEETATILALLTDTFPNLNAITRTTARTIILVLPKKSKMLTSKIILKLG